MVIYFILTYAILNNGLTMILGDKILQDCEFDQEIKIDEKNDLKNLLLTKNEQRITRKNDETLSNIQFINDKQPININTLIRENVYQWSSPDMLQNKSNTPHFHSFEPIYTSSNFYPTIDKKFFFNFKNPWAIENKLKRNDVTIPFWNYGLVNPYSQLWPYSPNVQYPPPFVPAKMPIPFSTMTIPNLYEMALESSPTIHWYNYFNSPSYPLPLYPSFLTEDGATKFKTTLKENENKKKTHHKSSSRKSKKNWALAFRRKPLPSLKSIFRKTKGRGFLNQNEDE